ncbi:type VI secretion system-associated protein [Bordetella genomosp. 8]|uniref:Type VI secretion system-associated protein n=1 Tax=Bordetella genomosp. 8 TaxID=1416806 RepID=A0A1W6YQI0_9BORD|nr:type VI secretion system contractile sheath small subunit [Bordetella genomosp. 8]ARP83352.1 type VI secretion system-associated protein [Bordetella genomosp. 8]
MAKENSQKSIGRMRPPRVQIEYEVEVNGAEKKVNLPFVMGVMSDLSGQSLEALPPVAVRKFLEIDSENFDDRMAAIKPRVATSVPNALTGEGNLGVDITFECMDDFSPAAIARKVEPLRRMLEARSHLANLMTYMDGKVSAEDMVSRLLSDPALMQTLAQPATPGEGGEGDDAGAGQAPASGEPEGAAPQS